MPNFKKIKRATRNANNTANNSQTTRNTSGNSTSKTSQAQKPMTYPKAIWITVQHYAVQVIKAILWLAVASASQQYNNNYAYSVSMGLQNVTQQQYALLAVQTQSRLNFTAMVTAIVVGIAFVMIIKTFKWRPSDKAKQALMEAHKNRKLKKSR